MIAYDESGTAFTLGGRLASGGQGVIWKLDGLPGYLAKIYHERPNGKQVEKLKLLRERSKELVNVAALPLSIAYAETALKNPIGIFIPFVDGFEIFEVYGTRSRIQHFPNANFNFLIRAAYNLAAAFEELHNHGVIVGDVNEQNIKVQKDATVRLIDCDSFQISNGSTAYTSDVGTPLWTPPELHGRNLTGLQRTPNHDFFGLAQLIFLLLFTGRHPFAGVPRTSRHMLPEDAIREHAFAFAPAHLNLPLSPPPGCPRLDVLPPEMGNAFSKAFLKESIHPNGRTTAAQWRGILTKVASELVACAQNSAHMFWKGAKSCPWCLVVRETGVDLFPVPFNGVAGARGGATTDDSYVTGLASLRPHPFTISRPPSFTDLNAAPLPEQPTGIWSGLHRFFSAQGWKQNWLGSQLRSRIATIHACEAQIAKNLVDQQNTIGIYQRDFTKHFAPLPALVQGLKNPSSIRAECLRVMKDDGKRRALDAYLQRFFIRRTKIPHIGPARQAALGSFGVETAADITSGALSRVYGLPVNARAELLDWRRKLESRFVFDPNQPLSQAQQVETERRAQERLRKMREDAAAIEVRLKEVFQTAQLALRSQVAILHQLARERDQAKADVSAMQHELSLP